MNIPIIPELIDRARVWKLGVHRLTVDEVDRLNRTRHRGQLIEAIPSVDDNPELGSIVNFLHPIHSMLESKFLNKPVAFEIWSYRKRFGFYFFSKDREVVQQIISQVNAIYPNAAFKESDTKHVQLEAGDYVSSAIVSVENYISEIKWLEFFDYDPLSHILEAMSSDSMLQIIFKVHKIPERIIAQAEAEMPDKIVRLPYFRVLIRLTAISSDPFGAKLAAEQIANAFSVFNGNAYFKANLAGIFSFTDSYSVLKKIVKRSFPWYFDFERRQTSILCGHELASFVHLPIGIEGISLHNHSDNSSNSNNSNPNSIAIGSVKFRGKPIEKTSVPLSDLSRHVYIIGATGTGKSSLLINMIAQAQKRGVCVHLIDPHGDMAYELVECVGKERLANVVFFDPIKVKFSINPFELPPYADRYEREMVIERIIGQMTELMKKLFGARYWGPALNRTFQNVIRILYKKDDSPTFEDVLNVLLGRTEKFRELVQNHEFQDLSYELQKIPKERIDAVLNKVDPFVKNALLRMIFCNKQSTVDFKELLQPGKVVIWRLSKAELTEQNMQMIGSAIITKLWFHCASRARDHRTPILLAIDEFQNFAHLETLQVMVTEARKFGVSLILSHQHTKQLPESVLSEVLGNTATKIIFRVSGEDAVTLSKTLDISSARMLSSDLTNLPDGSAIVKLRAKFGDESVAPFEIFTLQPMERKSIDFNSLLIKMQERFSAPSLIQAPPAVRIEDSPKVSEELSEGMVEFLKVVSEVGGKGKFVLYTSLRASMKRFKELVEKAESKGLIKTYEVKTGKRPLEAVALTEKGQEVLRGFLGRKGSLWHQRTSESIAAYYQRFGDRVFKERGGRAEEPDLRVIRKDATRVIWQFETDASHPEQVLNNFENFRDKCDVFCFGVPDEAVGKRVIKILKSRGYELRRDYFVYKITFDKSEENVFECA